MTRITADLAALAAVACAAWARDDAPRFAVASVKAVPAPGRDGGGGPSPGGERFHASATLRGLIEKAYRVRSELLSGGPPWMDRDFFEVDAKAEGPSTNAEMRAMLRNLLADRFALRVRRQTKEMPVYALAVDAGGPRLVRAADPAAGNPAIDQAMDPWPSNRLKWKARAWPMDFLVERLGFFVDRPVIDATGIAGRYDFDLAFVENVDPAILDRLTATGHFDPHPTIFEALRQQLGLRLEPRKGPVETIVVEHAERPGAN